MNRAFVDFVIKDYSKPMGYKTSKDMPEGLKKALLDLDDLKSCLRNMIERVML